jgi:hypothetical protein
LRAHSPVIRAALLAHPGNGLTRRHAFSQSQDYRLSLALNPFELQVGGGRVRVFQRIDFGGRLDRATYTWIAVGRIKIRFYDGLISLLGGKPFIAESTWQID